MAYVLGAKSRAELSGVHPYLVRVVERAIQITSQDFTVHDGLRTAAEQRVLVAKGASKTLDSKHLKQGDGYGHAVDLVPWVNGKPRWEWPLIFPIATAMWRASGELGIRIRWGGCWQPMDSFKSGTQAEFERGMQAYTAAQKAKGKTALHDGPHFELVL